MSRRSARSLARGGLRNLRYCWKGPLSTSGFGPKRRFAASQRYVRSWGLSRHAKTARPTRLTQRQLGQIKMLRRSEPLT